MHTCSSVVGPLNCGAVASGGLGEGRSAGGYCDGLCNSVSEGIWVGYSRAGWAVVLYNNSTKESVPTEASSMHDT